MFYIVKIFGEAELEFFRSEENAKNSLWSDFIEVCANEYTEEELKVLKESCDKDGWIDEFGYVGEGYFSD